MLKEGGDASWFMIENLKKDRLKLITKYDLWLVLTCRLLGLSRFGTQGSLVKSISEYMKFIRADDKVQLFVF